MESFRSGEFVVLKVLLGLLNFVGFTENVAVIEAILLSYTLWDTPANWFVLSLAIVMQCSVYVMQCNMYAFSTRTTTA